MEATAPQQEMRQDNINGAVIPGKYIIVFKNDETLRLNPNATYEERVSAVRNMGRSILEANGVQNAQIEQAYGKAIFGIATSLTDAQLAQLRNDPRVDFIEQDRVVALAPPGGKGPGGGGTSPAQETPWGITRIGGAGNGAGKTAWVIDTGIDLDHPDLNVDVARSVTMFTSGKDSKNADDGNGHGTHVAGTIAALDNSIGVIGVAPGAAVVGVKVLDSRGSGSYSGVIAGVDYVAANAAAGDVANMSLGGPISQALDDAVKAAANKGIKFALAAGNDGADANNSSPARVNHPNVVTISASDVNDVMASWSNWGNPPVDYAAPGVSIKSTWLEGGYNTISGTSMASPHAAGIMLLGNITTSGFVTGDKDSTPDPIAHR